MAGALFRPLTERDRMQPQTADGGSMADHAATFIKPNDRLSSFERLEIYNRQYWFRLLGCFFEDYPGLRAVLGDRKFRRLAREYLARYPSASFTLRNLGSRLEKFLVEEPQWTEPRQALALDMARFEWAQVVAFDGEASPVLDIDSLLGADPATLRLSLQPYLSLLALDYPVDDCVLSLKKGALRAEASNAVDSSPKARAAGKLALPKPEKVCVAVHRHENSLYYKRLEPEAFQILAALQGGATVEDACAEALSTGRALDWPVVIKEWFENWCLLGWFCALPAA
jgi:hypothetical protein